VTHCTLHSSVLVRCVLCVCHVPAMASDEDCEDFDGGEHDMELNPLTGGGGESRNLRRNRRYERTLQRQRLQDKLNRHQYTVFCLAGCICLLLLIIVVGILLHFMDPHYRDHRRGAGQQQQLSAALAKKLVQLEAHSHTAGPESALFQDDLCAELRDADAADAVSCSDKGGVCVSDEDDCKEGVIKGTCGRDCGCCFAGCPAKWIGDGECDFECNDEQHHFGAPLPAGLKRNEVPVLVGVHGCARARSLCVSRALFVALPPPLLCLSSPQLIRCVVFGCRWR
jgi:hypothetical protein